MNDNERAALVEEMENLFAWSWGKDLKTGRQVLAELGDDPAPHHRRETMFANKAVEIFDRLLATRTAPTVDDDAMEGVANSIARQIRIAGMHVTDSSGKKVYPDWLGIVRTAIAEYNAWLWEQAVRPEVVDDVAASIPFVFLGSHSIEAVRTNWETREEIRGDRNKLVLRREALNAITTLLTALIGPRPQGGEG